MKAMLGYFVGRNHKACYGDYRLWYLGGKVNIEYVAAGMVGGALRSLQRRNAASGYIP